MRAFNEIGFEIVARTFLLAFGGASILIVAALCYILWLISRETRKRIMTPEIEGSLKNIKEFKLALPIICGVGMATVVASYLLAGQECPLLGGYSSGVMILFGVLLSAVAYFFRLRDGVDDDRLRYAMMVWVGISILVALGLLWLAWIRPHLQFDKSMIEFGKDSLGGFANGIAQLLGIIIAAILVVTTNSINAKRDRETTHQQIYQNLELASIDLFRFENNPETRSLISAVWADGDVALNDVDRYRVQEYVCQFLNLFEMGVRFRRDDVMPHDVFGSWLIWIWELCGRPVFQALWEKDLKWNYIELLRNVISDGIKRQLEPGNDSEKREKFFADVSGIFTDCPYCKNWFRNISK